jgi:integrase
MWHPETWKKLVAHLEDRMSREGTRVTSRAMLDGVIIALHTGCRLTEIGDLRPEDVEDDGSCRSDGLAFSLPDAETRSGRRWVPLAGEAAEVMRRRFSEARRSGATDLFFDITTLGRDGSRGSNLGEKFGIEKEKVFGKEASNVLTFHSFRHTWRTMARRSGIPAATQKQLGGWEQDGRDTASPYDHGLTKEQLREAQERIVERLRAEGFRT